MRDYLCNTLASRTGLDAADIQEMMETASVEKGLVATLAERDGMTEARALEAVSNTFDIPFRLKALSWSSDAEFVRELPIQYFKRHLFFPVLADDGVVTLMLHDPMTLEAASDLYGILGVDRIDPVLMPRQLILSAIHAAYDQNRDTAEQLVQDMTDASGESILNEIEEAADLLDDVGDAPIIKLVNHIIAQAAKANSSDIHIEPYQDRFVIRYRMDGVLYELMSPPKWMQAPLVSRIKVMARLNIAEKRLPQDGRLEVRIGEENIDIRISTIPTSFGERVVMRLLNKSASLLKLSEFGMTSDTFAAISRLIRRPNGIVLVTGPTGSGKTTSLYAMLSEINRPDINIVTIEDPVEYRIHGIGQIQVNPKIGLTFAKGLRSIVRQDPDVILVGEIRDNETAEIAVQSALTGHLVFSTLHTNDSASAITRLVDIGIEPFLISSAVQAVIAQRLIRVLCPDCKEEFVPTAEELEVLGEGGAMLAGHRLYRAVGCSECLQSGYRGRMSIYEIMEMDSALRGVVLKTSDAGPIQAAAVSAGMRTLRVDGIRRVAEGLTTIEEVLRVTHD